jgi:PAS domain-containing protein
VTWQLCAAPQNGWSVISPFPKPHFFIGLFNTLLLSAFVWWLVERPKQIQRRNQHLQQEIDARVRAEQKLRFSEQKYASFFQLMPGHGRHHKRLKTGCFLEINQGFTRRLPGWRSEESSAGPPSNLGLWTMMKRKQAVALLKTAWPSGKFPFFPPT